MRQSARSLHQAGFSMVEILVGLSFLLVLGIVSIETSVFAGRTSAATVHLSALDQRAHRAVTRVTRELQEARIGALLPDPVPPYGASTMSYQCAEIAAAGDIVWGEYRRLELVPSADDPTDGLDNNGNGLTDEHDLHLIHDVGLSTERVAVLVRNVAALLEDEQMNAVDDNGNGLVDERGFSITRLGGVLEVRLSLQALDHEGQITTLTVEATVWPRN